MHISGQVPLQTQKRGNGESQGDKKPHKARKYKHRMSNLGLEGVAQALLCSGHVARGACQHNALEGSEE